MSTGIANTNTNGQVQVFFRWRSEEGGEHQAHPCPHTYPPAGHPIYYPRDYIGRQTAQAGGILEQVGHLLGLTTRVLGFGVYITGMVGLMVNDSSILTRPCTPVHHKQSQNPQQPGSQTHTHNSEGGLPNPAKVFQKNPR